MATVSEFDFDTITTRIMLKVSDYLPKTISDAKYIKLSEEVHDIVSREFRMKKDLTDRDPRAARAYAIRRANNLFGGTCDKCQAHFDDPPCVSTQPTLYGCENFSERR